MSRRDRRLWRHVEAQLHDSRPGRVEAEDVDATRVAAALHAEHPGAGDPDPGFVDALARRLRREAAADVVPAPDRRRFIAAAGLTAAAAAVGVGAGVGIDRFRSTAPPEPTPPAQPEAVLAPDDGVWVAVAAAADLRSTSVQRFSANGVEGFLVSTAGTISAVSAVCTDQGCILRDDPAAGQLVCPCHGATFAVDGTPTGRSYSHAVSPLPRLKVRVGEQVEVLLPRTS